MVHFLNCVLSVAYVIGIYMFYFLFQRVGLKNNPIELKVRPIEAKITYNPHWVWVYSGIYYPIILLPCFLTDMKGMVPVWVSGLILLLLQGIFFVRYPVKTPSHWRKTVHTNFAEKILIGLVQKIDKSNNCFPSMHVSVATLISCHLAHLLDSHWYLEIWLFPLLIGWSCLKTKQHYIVDLLPAPFLGYLAFDLSRTLLW